MVTQKRVLDGGNVLDLEAWTAAGRTYRALGRRAG
jgi:UDPglucose 6-dehydrogenase